MPANIDSYILALKTAEETKEDELQLIQQQLVEDLLTEIDTQLDTAAPNLFLIHSPSDNFTTIKIKLKTNGFELKCEFNTLVSSKEVRRKAKKILGVKKRFTVDAKIYEVYAVSSDENTATTIFFEHDSTWT